MSGKATVTFQLRMPEALKRKVDEGASKAGRSRNTEMVRRLERSYRASEKARAKRAQVAA